MSPLWALFPTYGGYGGPGYSAYGRGVDPRLHAAPALSAADDIYREHDLAYSHATSFADVRSADRELISRGVEHLLAPSHFFDDPYGYAYTGAAVLAFTGKELAAEYGLNLGTV